MAPLTDPIKLEAYCDAIRNWPFNGFVRFELPEAAHRWVKRELENITLKELSRLMCEYIDGGGEIDEVKETRAEWSDYEFHYDLRFTVHDRLVYVESRLEFSLPLQADESTIIVVNIHEP